MPGFAAAASSQQQFHQSRRTNYQQQQLVAQPSLSSSSSSANVGGSGGGGGALDMPDLSHLSESERKIIEAVLERQKAEEAKDACLVRSNPILPMRQVQSTVSFVFFAPKPRL